MVEMRNAYTILVGKPEGKRPLGRLRRRWDDNIRIGHRKVGLGVVAWKHVAQDRDQWRVIVNTIMNLRVPYKVGNLLNSWATISFSRILLHGVS
jgi:hypothetical protein